MDAPRGFEPRLTESESVVLPLDDGAGAAPSRAGLVDSQDAGLADSPGGVSIGARCPSPPAGSKKCDVPRWRKNLQPKTNARVSGGSGKQARREPHGPAGPQQEQKPGPSDGRLYSSIAQPRDHIELPRPAFPRQSYAAIDLGTNNCRLLIARPSGENFVVIDAFSRVVRLGEGLAQTGRLSEQAMDRALAALKVCADKLMRRNIYLARSVATEACRRASNGADFIERVRQETGIVLDIISAREEARLAVLGCHVLLERDSARR